MQAADPPKHEFNFERTTCSYPSWIQTISGLAKGFLSPSHNEQWYCPDVLDFDQLAKFGNKENPSEPHISIHSKTPHPESTLVRFLYWLAHPSQPSITEWSKIIAASVELMANNLYAPPAPITDNNDQLVQGVQVLKQIEAIKNSLSSFDTPDTDPSPNNPQPSPRAPSGDVLHKFRSVILDVYAAYCKPPLWLGSQTLHSDVTPPFLAFTFESPSWLHRDLSFHLSEPGSLARPISTFPSPFSEGHSQLRYCWFMTTRSNTDPDKLLPLTDPEAIIRSGNAEQRRLKHLKSNPTIPLPPPSETTPATAMSDNTAPAHETSGLTRTADAADMQTAKDWFKSVFKLQHAFIVETQAERRQAAEDRRQALEDRRADRQILISAHQASAARISQLEELLLAMNIKNKVEARPVQTNPGKINLQKFRTLDGPTYRGPFQETESFLRWIHGVQIFFETKDVTNAADKIKILGNLIAETNLQSFYANKAADFLTKSWEEFKARLFDFALPTNWRSGLQRQIRQLDMSPTETLLEYSTRARTLQSLFNFDASKPSKLGDLQLAQFVVYGLPDSLQDRINKRQLLEVIPFSYGPFEKQANTSFMALQRPAVPPAPTRSTPSAPSNLARDEFVWRVHSYLDLLGLCHLCKKHCGNAAGACPGPIDRSRIDIPSGFATPEKPANHVAPRAWNRPTTTP
ncbi:hypothetical protein PGTUg99_017323 [Puccinia graminis f. sp. tritici]|uniref:Retrotransposon gag domain-containing protein n=1 Tax=Puccinia graminis f. sp. tritici TaxID=56615 RepID=A0A5B0QHC4_PUCGR|nr:hypothetical protein PGTUg99_017323 [Puccinia graminis f. sp. tritici]